MNLFGAPCFAFCYNFLKQILFHISVPSRWPNNDEMAILGRADFQYGSFIGSYQQFSQLLHLLVQTPNNFTFLQTQKFPCKRLHFAQGPHHYEHSGFGWQKCRNGIAQWENWDQWGGPRWGENEKDQWKGRTNDPGQNGPWCRYWNLSWMKTILMFWKCCHLHFCLDWNCLQCVKVYFSQNDFSCILTQMFVYSCSYRDICS